MYVNFLSPYIPLLIYKLNVRNHLYSQYLPEDEIQNIGRRRKLK